MKDFWRGGGGEDRLTRFRGSFSDGAVKGTPTFPSNKQLNAQRQPNAADI